MHIPEGFVAPQVYVPAYAVSMGLALYGFRKFKERLSERSIPRLALLSAFAFILSSLSFPLPGGTSVHGVGVAPLALLYGPWTAYLCMCLVLLLQAVLLGHGGITTYPVNALAMGFVGAFSSYAVHRLFAKKSNAPFLAGFFSTLLSALSVALLLGVHPYLFTDPSGRALYFPYPLGITLPAITLSHLPVAVVEGLITQAVVGLLRRRNLEG
ncbi:MAG: energy-coupling factor ABC transporter permease [Aquificaceae bacterium]|jgi:cobalt/nickel transport system permease protein|uniref:energy-coupling factor ABC transporter permease n=1 Tax=Hydrogenobacter sp. Uz 6-8 TaxID=3384828 RepID=UPI000F1D42DC|nr:MAG: cobalamin biosynthesis protein CbiM [Aquificota bacterium]